MPIDQVFGLSATDRQSADERHWRAFGRRFLLCLRVSVVKMPEQPLFLARPHRILEIHRRMERFVLRPVERRPSASSPFGVTLLGAYVRLSDAGLGCPDWPGCYGHLVVRVPITPSPPRTRPILPARSTAQGLGKRWCTVYLAGSLGLASLALALIGWRHRRSGLPVVLPTVLVGLVAFQALLGMWTVTLLVNPAIVTAHLAGGMATLALLWWLTLRQGRLWTAPTGAGRRSPRPWAILGIALVVVQICSRLDQLELRRAPPAPSSPRATAANGGPAADFAEGFTLWRPLGVDYEFGVLDSPARTAIHLAHRLGRPGRRHPGRRARGLGDPQRRVGRGAPHRGSAAGDPRPAGRARHHQRPRQLPLPVAVAHSGGAGAPAARAGESGTRADAGRTPAAHPARGDDHDATSLARPADRCRRAASRAHGSARASSCPISHRVRPRPRLPPAPLLPQPRALTPFALTGRRGPPFTEASLQGRWTLLAFGYASCPDVLPAASGLVPRHPSPPRGARAGRGGAVRVRLGRSRARRPRTPRDYVRLLQSAFLGATGPHPELQRLTRQLGVLYQRAGDGDSAVGYLVDHAASLLLVDPQGRFTAVFSAPHAALAMAADIAALVADGR